MALPKLDTPTYELEQPSTGQTIKYRPFLVKEQKTLNKFDLVIASEVIEHVNDRNAFLSDISNLCRPGGLVVFTTINNSFLGILFGKYFAEDILKILPAGTHEVEKFISPENLLSSPLK